MMNSSYFSSSATMESVRHILIRTCMGQIQKELGHLEHWLIHLPEDAKGAATDLPAPSVPPATNATSTDIQRLVTSVEQLTKQMELQQLTLDQIIRRLAVLESVKGVHIDSDSDSDSHSDSPWMDDAPAPFVPETPQEEVVYIVHKTDTEAAVEMKKEEEDVQDVQDVQAVEVKKEVVKQEEPIQAVEVKQEEVKQEEPVQAVEVRQEKPVQVVEVKQEEVKQEEPIQVAEVKQEEPVQVAEVKQEQEQEEVEVEGEEEEEEEDVELEEISYKGEVYYRDPQQFVYSVNSEGEVSEEPIGYWKAKTKSIAFYNKK